jgi:hypothetical protein
MQAVLGRHHRCVAALLEAGVGASTGGLNGLLLGASGGDAG